MGITSSIVQANDHGEGLFGLVLARRIKARTVVLLRSPSMTRDDYFKYGCHEYDFIAAVGEPFRTNVQAWESRKQVALVPDGVYGDEILPPKEKPRRPPDRVLVIGSPLAWKGWADLTDAVFLMEQEGVLPPTQFDFTGTMPDKRDNDLRLGRLASARFRFLGRVDAFRELVRGYDLVINPSRMETFGMAAVEVVAAGVPLLSSRTGVIEQVIEVPDALFPPSRPDKLARTLARVFCQWEECDFGTRRGQENIRRRFMIDSTVDKLSQAYDELLSGSAP
jgi:glycosyltransferase involved in cell wall biosynthesis